MKNIYRLLSMTLLMLAVAGCGSTKVTMRDTYQGAKIPRPDRIVVFDFATNTAGLPAWSDAAQQFGQQASMGSPEDQETGRELGIQIARELVTQIRALGLTAVTNSAATAAQPGDGMLIGYFAGVEEGSRGKRVMLGFGAGATDLKTYVEGYLMTENGPRKLGSGATDSGGGKTPGLLLPIAVVAATANPIGLVVGGGMHAYGELSGKNTVQAAAKETAELLGKELEAAFKRHGWI
jgi:hypothetical protein